MISITLRNFINFIIVRFLWNIPGYLYLRSNGHKEYQKIGPLKFILRFVIKIFEETIKNDFCIKTNLSF